MTYSTDQADWRVLTVRQPWAWAIRPGGKTVENRAPAALGWVKAIGCHVMIRDRGRYHPLLGGSGVAGMRYSDRDPVRLPSGHPDRLITADHPDHLYALRHVPAYRHLPPRPFRHSAVLSVARLDRVHSALDPECDCPEQWAELQYPDAAGELVAPATHLVFGNIAVLEVPVADGSNGRLGLTRPTQELLSDVLCALEATDARP